MTTTTTATTDPSFADWHASLVQDNAWAQTDSDRNDDPDSADQPDGECAICGVPTDDDMCWYCAAQ